MYTEGFYKISYLLALNKNQNENGENALPSRVIERITVHALEVGRYVCDLARMHD